MKLSRYEMMSHHRAAPCYCKSKDPDAPCNETHISCVLFTCTICGCSERELPTECPNYKVDAATREAFSNGELDWKNGEFIKLNKDTP